MKLPRLFWWLIVAAALLLFIALLQPQQLPVTLYKLSLLIIAGVVGYRLDRAIFFYARPDYFLSVQARTGSLQVDQPNQASGNVDVEVRDGFPWSVAQQALRYFVQTETPPAPGEQCAFPSEADPGLALLCASSMLRRAIVIGCAMLTMGLGA